MSSDDSSTSSTRSSGETVLVVRSCPGTDETSDPSSESPPSCPRPFTSLQEQQQGESSSLQRQQQSLAPGQQQDDQPQEDYKEMLELLTQTPSAAEQVPADEVER
ncbi:MAG: hypothetical protein WDW38_011422 [Sanguina aurantia]